MVVDDSVTNDRVAISPGAGFMPGCFSASNSQPRGRDPFHDARLPHAVR
jgi:hypothetical protein